MTGAPSRRGTERLPTADHAGRRARLQDRLRVEGLSALLVTRQANVRYLTGFSGSAGRLLVGVDGRVLLITDGRYDERARREAPGVPLAVTRDWQDEVAGFVAVDDRLGFEADGIPYDAGVRLVDALTSAGFDARPVTGHVEALRTVKDDHETAALRIACELTVEAWQQVLAEVGEGMTERDIARRLERAMVDLGADAPAFAPIVAGGPNSAIPHHEPTDRPLGRGDLLTVDLGARYAGYHADMTRTVAVGTAPDGLRELHDLVREAQAAGVAAARADTPARTVDAACRDRIEAAGHGERFVHGTGHGVGLEIHEAPAVSASSRATLEAGTTLTVEPGVYLPGRGGVRIEDTVVVTGDGPALRLTTAPRDLLVL